MWGYIVFLGLITGIIITSMRFPALETMLNHAILEHETLPDNGNIGCHIDIPEIRARCLYHVLVSRESMQL